MSKTSQYIAKFHFILSVAYFLPDRAGFCLGHKSTDGGGALGTDLFFRMIKRGEKQALIVFSFNPLSFFFDGHVALGIVFNLFVVHSPY